ncbi:MAG: hypothetical protein JW737_04575 [Acidobacteria bacterium]|nr:hypothetical protein [Acidobacteriota bacterium]
MAAPESNLWCSGMNDENDRIKRDLEDWLAGFPGRAMMIERIMNLINDGELNISKRFLLEHTVNNEKFRTQWSKWEVLAKEKGQDDTEVQDKLNVLLTRWELKDFEPDPAVFQIEWSKIKAYLLKVADYPVGQKKVDDDLHDEYREQKIDEIRREMLMAASKHMKIDVLPVSQDEEDVYYDPDIIETQLQQADKNAFNYHLEFMAANEKFQAEWLHSEHIAEIYGRNSQKYKNRHRDLLIRWGIKNSNYQPLYELKTSRIKTKIEVSFSINAKLSEDRIKKVLQKSVYLAIKEERDLAIFLSDNLRKQGGAVKFGPGGPEYQGDIDLLYDYIPNRNEEKNKPKINKKIDLEEYQKRLDAWKEYQATGSPYKVHKKLKLPDTTSAKLHIKQAEKYIRWGIPGFKPFPQD